MGHELYAASTRSSTADEGRTTRHSFSFGTHYDPANLGFGPMVCHNDDVLQPGGGYPDHPHTDLEIVTWVLAGALVHTDPGGGRRVVGPGQVQVLGAGAGIRHSEVGDAAAGPTRFVQVWVRPDEPGLPPRHEVVDTDPATGVLVPVAGGDGPAVRTTGARLLVARLSPGDVVRLPASRRQHVFAATGAVTLAGTRLGEGDALRVVDEPGHEAVAQEAGELLVWAFD